MIDASLTLPEAAEKARGGSDVQILCPGHDDSSPSLSVAYSSGKGLLLNCHAGCETKAILDAVGWTWADLFDPDDNLAPEGRGSWTPAGEASHIYPYIDEQGSVLYEVLRVPKVGGGKTFFQRTWSEVQSKYIWSVRDVRRVLYRLPDVLNCVANGETVYVTEGERDADTVRRMGLCSTTNAMGAGKWEDGYTDSLAGATVVMLSDADQAGRAHVRMVRERLIEAGCRVEIREPRGDFKDITEMHQKGGGGIDEMMVVVPFQDAERIKFGIDVLDVILRPASITEFVIPGTLARRERLLVTGLEGHGKGLSLSTAIPTVHGWTSMADIQVGDVVFDKDGSPCTVTGLSGYYMPDSMYRITFSDGTVMEADGDHQWLTHTLRAREVESVQRKRDETLSKRGTDQRHKIKHKPAVVNTTQISETLTISRSGGQVTNHSIKAAGALDTELVDVPIPPYTLGAWLGDGTTSSSTIAVATRDAAIRDGIAADGYEMSVAAERNSVEVTNPYGLVTKLRSQGLLGYKHIPEIYFRASCEQRLALLAGLCDTDGYQDARGATTGRGAGESRIELCFTDERLATDAIALIRTLGIIPHLNMGEAKIGDKSYGAKYRIFFSSPFNPFRHCAFKRDRWRPLRTARSQHRYITSVERIEPQLVQCIQVDSSDHTYLAGRELVPTHNSTLLRQIAVQVAAGIHPFALTEAEPKRVLVIDAENEPGQTRQSWTDLVGLAAYHGHPIERDQLIVLEEWDTEIDLADKAWHEWLHERIHGYQPDLVILGPLTNLVGRDLKDDEPVRRLKSAINTGRTICDSAFIMEHHAPHRNPSDKKRSLRPYGSSMFLKWPDYGYGMSPDADREGHYQWERTRWPRVRTRNWPDTLRWGKPNTSEWCWMEAEPA